MKNVGMKLNDALYLVKKNGGWNEWDQSYDNICRQGWTFYVVFIFDNKNCLDTSSRL